MAETKSLENQILELQKENLALIDKNLKQRQEIVEIKEKNLEKTLQYERKIFQT